MKGQTQISYIKNILSSEHLPLSFVTKFYLRIDHHILSIYTSSGLVTYLGETFTEDIRFLAEEFDSCCADVPSQSSELHSVCSNCILQLHHLLPGNHHMHQMALSLDTIGHGTHFHFPGGPKVLNTGGRYNTTW